MILNKNHNYGIIIQVLLSSSRLKKKPILKINNKEMIIFQIELLKKNFDPKKIILATSNSEIDDKLIEIAKKMKINYYRGHKKDVLKRILNTCYKFKIDDAILVNGDNPLVHPAIIKKMYFKFKKRNLDYIDGYKEVPIGLWPKIIKKSAIEKVCEFKNKIDTEAYSVWFYRLNNIFKVDKYKDKKLKKFLKVRLTVDEIDDFNLVKIIIIKFFNSKNNSYNLFQMLNYINNNKKILNINSNIKQISGDKFPFGLKKKYLKLL